VIRDSLLLAGRQLNDRATREFLEIAGQLENTVALVKPLQDVAGGANLAAAALLTDDGKTKVGPGGATPPGALSTKTYCAALIAETWVYFHNCAPAPRSRDAAAAADAYWRACGGKRRGWGKDPL